jgi:S-adenosylmethionine:tRNA-ribosyltransferase-isomerase (queuine synthetase)
MPDSQPPHSLRVDDLDYHLPPGLIATRPADPRDSARLLVMWRSSERIDHRRIHDLPEYLLPSDSIVFNTTSVLPARFFGLRTTGGRVEGLFLDEQVDDGNDTMWHVMLKAGGRLGAGDVINVLDRDGAATSTALKLIRKQETDEVAQRIRNVVFATTLEVDVKIVRIKANVGAASFPVQGNNLQAVMAAADRNMYKDKDLREPPKGKLIIQKR